LNLFPLSYLQIEKDAAKEGSILKIGNTELSLFCRMNRNQDLLQTYFLLLEKQSFDPGSLDYSVLENQKSVLEELARIGNSGICVFDLYQKEHIFHSSNFATMLGYDLALVEKEGNAYIDSRVHPEDFTGLLECGIEMMRFFLALPKEDFRKEQYKMVNEYRVIGSTGQFIRVVEQHHPFAFDPKGNIWLSLSVTDLSTFQDPSLPLRSQIVNYRTGEVISVDGISERSDLKRKGRMLTGREKEILKLIREGKFSKEISEALSISLHTVNTHRQRILEKLSSDNAMEAVRLASRMGLLD
jgi:DNA-binding CsgD family transcriptional regulator